MKAMMSDKLKAMLAGPELAREIQLALTRALEDEHNKRCAKCGKDIVQPIVCLGCMSV